MSAILTLTDSSAEIERLVTNVTQGEAACVVHPQGSPAR
jgi:hypothetical protein